MAELTAEDVRRIVKEEISTEINSLERRLDARFEEARAETASGIQSVLNAVQGVTDEDRDEIAGVKGRLHNHNERIAKLERLNGLRA